MQYIQTPEPDTQRQPLEPHKIISGGLPGATQIRIGGNENVLIDGKNQRISITQTDGSSVGIGSIPGTTSFGFYATDTSGNVITKAIGGSITVTNTDGSTVGLGLIPGTAQFGFFSTDTAGNLIQKLVGATRYIYDISNAKNIMQDGKLPDGTYGWAIAKAGNDVSSGF